MRHLPSESKIALKELPLGIVRIEPKQEIDIVQIPIVIFRPLHLIFHVQGDCDLVITSIQIDNIENLISETNALDIQMLSDEISRECRMRFDLPTMNFGSKLKIRIKSLETKRTIRVSGSVEGWSHQ